MFAGYFVTLLLYHQEWPYGDRMQKIVFIGKDLNHELIQTILDQCLLTNEEMNMGPNMWQDACNDYNDIIRLPKKMIV